MSDLNYVVRSFDEGRRVVEVDFGADGIARVILMSPLPVNVDELEARIRPYAAPKEAVEARTENVDLSYINKIIGQPRKTTRLELTRKNPPNSAPAVKSDQMEIVETAEREYVKEIVLEVLREQGLAQ